MNFEYIERVNEFSKTWFWWMDPISTCRADNCVEFARRATWCSATSKEVFDVFKSVKKESYKIYEGFNPEIFYKLDIPKKYDVVFVGSGSEKRVRIIKKLRDEGINITTFGPGFDNNSVFLDELNKVNNQARIVLNICRSNIFSNRVFEAAGTGSFVLSEWCQDIGNDFPRFVCYKNENNCVNLVKYYLDHSVIRETIAEKNYNVVLDYTWGNQMRKVLRIKDEG